MEDDGHVMTKEERKKNKKRGREEGEGEGGNGVKKIKAGEDAKKKRKKKGKEEEEGVKKKAKKQSKKKKSKKKSSRWSSSSSSSSSSESSSDDDEDRAKRRAGGGGGGATATTKSPLSSSSAQASLDSELRGALLSLKPIPSPATTTDKKKTKKQKGQDAGGGKRPPSPDSPSAILLAPPPPPLPASKAVAVANKQKPAPPLSGAVTSGLLLLPPPAAAAAARHGSMSAKKVLPILGGGGVKMTAEEVARRRARAQRFAGMNGGASAGAALDDDSVPATGGLVKVDALEGDYWDAPAIQGTCTHVEKDFIRQLQRVDPATVRPLPVLQEALARVKAHWRIKEEYEYAWSQLKSIRQDLMVQHINTNFTVQVYETHARVALEAGDLNEFNLCCSRLADLRTHHPSLTTSHSEFVAYRLLHALYMKHYQEIYSTLLKCDPSVRRSDPVEHAFAVIRAEARQDFHQFFRLYVSAPHMSAYLMDFLVLRMRRLAASCMFKSYRPTLPVSYITRELAFDDDDECRDFLVTTMKAVVIMSVVANGSRGEEGGQVEVVDCKAWCK